VAAWRLPDVARAQSTAADNRRGVTPGTDTKDIRVGVIGVRSRGVNHLRGMATNVAAICDVDRKILAVRGNEVQKHLGRTVKQFDDYRQLLQDPAIDAVSIATPNHWHTLMAIEALQAGKHVYVEKPVSHTVWEGRQLVAAAQKYGRIVQCGTQLRSSVAVQKGVELARSGELGLIQYAYATCYKPRKSIGLLKYPLQIPNHVNYELWCGPAQRKDIYRPSLHYDWHWDFNTGNGEVGNQGVHQLDIARWFLGHTDLPRRVISVGGRVGYLDAGETPNTLLTWFDYPQAPIYFECRGLPKSKVAWQEWETSMDTYRSSQVGVIVQCEKGYFHVPFSGEEVDVHDNQDQLVTKLKEPLPNHYHNWLQAIAANDTASVKGPILEGHVSTSLCHLANVSYRLGEHMAGAEIRDRLQAEQGSERMIEALERVQHHLQDNHIDVEKTHPLFLGPLLNVDPAQERFVDNDLADELLRREYRAPFEVPDLTASI
jgi:predicted dehydrogenase